MSKPRIVVSNVFYEVTSRGARGVKIFESIALKSFFLKELDNTLKMYNFQCYGWSILDDHYHLILKSSDISISKFMQRINSVYARHYNKMKNEQGTVFYRRFASVIAEQETCLKDLIRYVHLNPVRCGACTLDQLDTYHWCGHSSLINGDSDQIQNTTDVLKLFSGPDYLNVYREFIHSNHIDPNNEILIQHIRNANQGMEKFSQPEPWVIGTPKFVKYTLERDRCNRARVARHKRENITCENICKKVKAMFNISDDEFNRQGRLNERTAARLLFIYLGSTRFEFTGADLAKHIGITGSAVSRMLSQWKIEKDKESLIYKLLKEKMDSQTIAEVVIAGN